MIGANRTNFRGCRAAEQEQKLSIIHSSHHKLLPEAEMVVGIISLVKYGVLIPNNGILMQRNNPEG